MSIQPRKQRKARYEAPLHKRHNYLSANLSKDLREELGIRSLPLVLDDKVKVLRGDFKDHEGKIVDMNYKSYKTFVEGVVNQKPEGNPSLIPLDPSNLMIIDANMKDEKRMKNIKGDN